jgi:peptide/nickel transport system substrate-binding protein
MRISKRSCSIILITVIVLYLSAGFSVAGSRVQGQNRFGGTLVVGMLTSPPSLDWQSTKLIVEQNLCRHIWEGFVVYDATGKIQPMLAKQWKVSEDELTWTFYLREGVLFHNGKEMTAEDAAASARRWLDVTVTKGLSAITSVNAVDKYTVEFKLSEKIPLLLVLMATHNGHPIIMPKEVCEGVPAGKLTEYVGTGPYKFSEWKLDQYIKLEKFKDYKPIDMEPSGYAGAKYGYMDEIIFQFVPESSTLLAGLETGEFDIVAPISPMEVPRLSKNKNIALRRYPAWSLYCCFNMKSILQDVRLRQAMIIGLDMEEVMLLVGKAEENIELNPSRVRRDSIWYTGELEKYYNLKDTETAKKLMQEAGYEGEEIIILTSKHYTWAFDMAIALHKQLADIGFNIRLEVVDWPTLTSKRAEAEGWHLFTSAGTPGCVDPSMLAQNFMGDAVGWYDVPEVTEQMTIINTRGDFETRFEAWRKLEALLAENPASIGPGWIFEYRGSRSNLRGVPETNEEFYWNVYRE